MQLSEPTISFAPKLKENIGWIIAIIALGAILRAMHFFSWVQTPFFNGLFLDELYHHLWAKKILDGEFFPAGVFFRAPLYPYILSSIYAIFGDAGFAPRIFQHFWGLLSIVPIYLLALELFSNKRLAIFAAALWAIYPTQIFYESRLLLDSFFSAGIVWLMWFLVITRRKRTPLLCALIGFWFGLLALTRPTILILAPIVLIFLWSHVRWSSLISLLAMILAIAPVTLSNIANGDFVTISSQGGINFYIGNNAQSDGASAIIPELGRNWQYRQCAKLAERETGKELKPSQVSEFYTQKGIQYWRENTREAFALFGKKALLLLTSPEVGNNGNTYFLLKSSKNLRYMLWFWAIVFPLALVGLIWQGFQNRWLFTTSIIFYAFSIIAFFVCDRFRLPLIAMMIIPATAGIKVLWESIKNFRIIPLVALICALVLSLLDPYGWRRSDDALSHFMLGNIYLRDNKPDDAKAEYYRALEINPVTRGVHLNLGALHFKNEQFDSAEYQFRRELDARGEVCRALSNLGVIERLRGNYQMALYWGEKAVDECLDDPSATYNFIMTLFSTAYVRQADSLMQINFPENSDNPRFLNLAGAIAVSLGDTAKAESLWVSVLRNKERTFLELYDMGAIYSEQAGVGASPTRVRCWAYYNLANICVFKKNVARAEELLNLALAQDSTFAPGYSAMGAIMLAKNKLDDAEAFLFKAENLGHKAPDLYFNIAAVSARKRDYEMAQKYLEMTIALAPNYEPAKSALISIIELSKQEKAKEK